MSSFWQFLTVKWQLSGGSGIDTYRNTLKAKYIPPRRRDPHGPVGSPWLASHPTEQRSEGTRGPHPALPQVYLPRLHAKVLRAAQRAGGKVRLTWCFRDVTFTHGLGQIGAKWDKSLLFMILFQYTENNLS